MLLFQEKTRQENRALNFNGDRGAIFKLWEDPGEQNNLISDGNLAWVKSEVYQWMRKELKDVPLPLHGADNEKHMQLYKSLFPRFHMQWKKFEPDDFPKPDSDLFPTYE